MALVNCKECGEKVSSKAKACPNCGAKPPPQTSLVTWLVLIIIVIVVVPAFFSDTPNVTRSPQERAALAAQRDAERAAEREREVTEEAENRRKGFHCLSSFNGTHRGVANLVKERLRDPDSFEHVETRIAPIDENGEHILMMQYRGANGFGGINVETALATIKNSDCSATVTALQ